MDPDQQLRNLRDFLLVYNRMTEICFQRCSSNFNYRNLTMDEVQCVDNCAGKLIRSNHRLMNTYVHLMPKMVQRRMEEMEKKAEENAKAAEAAGSLNALPPATEAPPASQSPIVSSPPPEVSALLTPSVTDVGAQTHGSFSKPAGLDIPVEVNATTSSEVNLSAAMALTPAAGAAYASVLNDTGNGPFNTAGFSEPVITGTQNVFDSSAPAFIPSNPTSIAADVAAPTVAKSTESLSGPERATEVCPTSSQ